MKTPEVRALRRAKREQAARVLSAAGIRNVIYDKGSYLFVDDGGAGVDFWPSTGAWRVKDQSKEGMGLVDLVHHVRSVQRMGSPPRPLGNSAQRSSQSKR